MKNDKICINKSVVFIAVVGVILLGVVMATNYVNTQNLSTKSRANEVANNTTPVPPPPGGAVVTSGLILSELKTRATAAIQSLDNVLQTSGGLSSASELDSAKKLITNDVSIAEKAFVDITNEAQTLKDVVLSSNTKVLTNISVAATKVTEIETALATAKENTRQAQDKYDIDKRNLQQKENELNSNPDVATAKKVVDDARKFMDDAVVALFPGTSSIDPSILTELKSMLLTADTDKYIDSLDKRKVVVNLPIFTPAQRTSYLASLASLTSAQAKYTSAKVKAFDAEDLRSINSMIHSLEAKLEESAKKLQEATDFENGVADELRVAKDIKASYQAMLNGVMKEYELNSNGFARSLAETSALPTKFPYDGNVVNSNIDTSALAAIRTEVDKVNATLSVANAAFTQLDKDINEGTAGKDAQLASNETYCSNISPKGNYFPLLAYGASGSLINGGQVPDFALNYYNENCKVNEDRPLWNGKYGGGAKCYKTIGLCANTNKNVKKASIVNVGPNLEGNPSMCINREVDLQSCIDRRTAPNSVGESLDLCKANGKFGWVGMGSYTVVHDINTYLGVQPVTPTPAPASGLSDTCVLLRPNTTNVPCMVISPRYCQYKDDGYVVKSVDANGIGTYVDKNNDSKTWEAPGFDSDY